MVVDMSISSTSIIHRFLALFVAIVFLGTGCVGPTPDTVDGTDLGVDIGQESPDFTTTAFTGQEVSLSDYRGEKVLLDFWAMWCPFCATEIPEIQALHEQYPNLNVIGVHRSATESFEEAELYAQDLGVTYLMLRDDDDELYDLYSGGRPFMPLAILIDEDGIVQQRLLGPKTTEQIKELFN